MTEFPNNFDYVIYGTGIVESILSAALSTTGNSVLHIDRNEYYGGYSGCLRLSEIEKLIEKWKNVQDIENNDHIFSETDVHVKYPRCNLNVSSESLENNVNENGSIILSHNAWTERSLRLSMRNFEFELFPRLLLAESKIIHALIQSDVTRYLEFKFISKFATLSDEKIILIPINRSDIVKTKVFSLRQKRQLTSFLEWCFRVNMDDEIVSKYSDRPLFELMRTEKSLDSFTEKIILECMAMSSPSVETKEGIIKIKRLLLSFNKYGPYPIMWPNYGCGEIPQAFCRMSAVFGSVYSLQTTICSCWSQSSQNGEYDTTHEAQEQVPIDHRKIKLTLSNNCEVYTDKIISHKSYVNPCFLTNSDKMRWISRAIFVTDKSLIHGSRENNDILMFPFHLNQIEKPALLLEFPTDNSRSAHKEELYIVHLTSFTETMFDSKELFQDYVDIIFENYTVESVESLKPKILFECFFTIPEFSDIIFDLKREDDLRNHLVFVNSSSNDIEFDECLKEANNLFSNLSPGVEFLPRPPNPEDIIQLGQETISSTSQISGDFPFSTNFLQLNSEILDAPGDVSSAMTAVSTNDDEENGNIDGPTLSGLLAELELNVSSSDSIDVTQ